MNLQTEFNKYSLTNHTHTDLPNQTDIARIINLQQTANFVLEGDWTVRAGGEIEGGRMLIIPVNRIQSSSGYIEFKTTNGNWPRIRNLNGSEPDRIILSGRTFIMPNWGSLMERHIH